MRINITRKLAAPLAASLALTLGACGGVNMDNRTLYSVKQPVVERSNYVLDVNTSADGLPVSEQQRLAGWFESSTRASSSSTATVVPGDGRSPSRYRTLSTMPATGATIRVRSRSSCAARSSAGSSPTPRTTRSPRAARLLN